MARKVKSRPPTVEVLSFRSSGGYPYFKSIFMLIIAFALLVILAIFKILDIISLLLVLIVLAALIMVFGLSSALTVHRLGGKSLMLHHGWYFKCRIPLQNIRDVDETEEGVPGHGVNFLLGGNKLFITNSRVGLVKIMLHDRQRMGGLFGRLISEIVMNIDSPDQFVRLIRERAGLKPLPTQDVDKCPACGQRMLDEEREGTEVGPDVTMIECIFLVHNDGRLIASYKSGRVQTKETFSMTGMLTVIQDFVGDAFKRTEGSLRTLEHGDIKVLIERGSNFYLAVLVEGQVPPKLRKEMRRALNEVDNKFGDVLDEVWDGELTELLGLKKILAQILWI